MKTDREYDGWVGLVRKVVTESSYISSKPDKTTSSRSETEYVATYDRRGRRASELHGANVIYGSSSLTHIRNNKYDDKGNIVEYKKYIDGALQCVIVFTYDAEDKKVKEAVYKPDGTLSHTSTYKYDMRGKIIENINFNSDGAIDCKHIYTNKYDVVGNLIEVTVERWTNIKGELIYEPLFVIHNTITYYED